MEPGHEDREYAGPTGDVVFTWPPQWSPVMKTGNTRDDMPDGVDVILPQWSPVMKTGNTRPEP